MYSVPSIVGVGVDLGSSGTTVSTRRSDDGPMTRHFDRNPTGRAVADDAESVLPLIVRPELQEGSAPVALAVPATWSSTRRQAHARAAANAGFHRVFMVPEPEAAARYLAEVQGRELEPGTSLVVCSIGADSSTVGVVRRDGDRYVIEAATSADDIGGREFDRLLLDHLADRHRRAAPEYWQRALDPAETGLRASLLQEVRRAREHLTNHPTVAPSLPGAGRELRLTREEADQCLTPAILRIVALIEDALQEAGVAADAVADLLLVGGASRTPLVASIIRHHLGIEPILPEMPELVIAEGAALAALTHPEKTAAVKTSTEAGPPSRLRASPAVPAAILMVFVALIAVLGVALINRDTPSAEGLGADTVTDEMDFPSPPGANGESEPGETDPGETDPGEPETEPTGAPPTSEPAEQEPDDRTATPEPTPSALPSTRADPGEGPPTGEEEPASSGTVPDVVGASVSEAKQILADAGFTHVVTQGERRTQEGPASEHCETTGQDPRGGTRRAYDDRISVTYAYLGTDTC